MYCTTIVKFTSAGSINASLTHLETISISLSDTMQFISLLISLGIPRRLRILDLDKLRICAILSCRCGFSTIFNIQNIKWYQLTFYTSFCIGLVRALQWLLCHRVSAYLYHLHSEQLQWIFLTWNAPTCRYDGYIRVKKHRKNCQWCPVSS